MIGHHCRGGGDVARAIVIVKFYDGQDRSFRTELRSFRASVCGKSFVVVVIWKCVYFWFVLDWLKKYFSHLLEQTKKRLKYEL